MIFEDKPINIQQYYIETVNDNRYVNNGVQFPKIEIVNGWECTEDESNAIAVGDGRFYVVDHIINSASSLFGEDDSEENILLGHVAPIALDKRICSKDEYDKVFAYHESINAEAQAKISKPLTKEEKLADLRAVKEAARKAGMDVDEYNLSLTEDLDPNKTFKQKIMFEDLKPEFIDRLLISTDQIEVK